MNIIWVFFGSKLEKRPKIYRIRQNLSQIANCAILQDPKLATFYQDMDTNQHSQTKKYINISRNKRFYQIIYTSCSSYFIYKHAYTHTHTHTHKHTLTRNRSP